MKRRRTLEDLNAIDWVGLACEIGIALFCLITFVRCALKD